MAQCHACALATCRSLWPTSAQRNLHAHALISATTSAGAASRQARADVIRCSGRVAGSEGRFAPRRQLAYMLEDSGSTVVLATEQHADQLRPVAESTGAALHVRNWLFVGVGVGKSGCHAGTNRLAPAQLPPPAGCRGSACRWTAKMCCRLPVQVLDTPTPRFEGNAPSLAPFIAEAFERQDGGGGDHRAALFIYTSGTTGAPKGKAPVSLPPASLLCCLHYVKSKAR
jgi:acyl-CoA synthetase (AMP-forming)/AMP-acid ligase II